MRKKANSTQIQLEKGLRIKEAVSNQIKAQIWKTYSLFIYKKLMKILMKKTLLIKELRIL